MATDAIKYTNYAEAVFIDLRLMKLLGEIRYDVDHRSLIESALL